MSQNISEADLRSFARINTSPGKPDTGQMRPSLYPPDFNETVRVTVEKAGKEMRERIRSKTWPKWF